MKIDLAKANAAIDEYVATLQKPDVFPYQISSLYWTKMCLERNGVIPDWRKLDLMDHCVLWVACIVACRRVMEVSQLEIERHAVKKGKSLRKTIRAMRMIRSPYRDRLEKHLADTKN